MSLVRACGVIVRSRGWFTTTPAALASAKARPKAETRRVVRRQKDGTLVRVK